MSFTTYAGIELLDWISDSAESTDEPVSETGSALVPAGGGMSPAWASPWARWTRTFRYTVQTRADLKLLHDFIDRRAGMFAPCWVPTYNDDLVARGTLAFGASAITIVTPGIATVRALGTLALRHLAILPAAGGVYPVRAGGLTDNGDGTSTLNIDTSSYGGPALGNVLAGAPFWRVSALKYARLTSDDVVFDYSAPGIVTATLPFVELPLETP